MASQSDLEKQQLKNAYRAHVTEGDFEEEEEEEGLPPQKARETVQFWNIALAQEEQAANQPDTQKKKPWQWWKKNEKPTMRVSAVSPGEDGQSDTRVNATPIVAFPEPAVGNPQPFHNLPSSNRAPVRTTRPQKIPLAQKFAGHVWKSALLCFIIFQGALITACARTSSKDEYVSGEIIDGKSLMRTEMQVYAGIILTSGLFFLHIMTTALLGRFAARHYAFLMWVVVGALMNVYLLGRVTEFATSYVYELRKSEEA